jgi:hypothetical protein
VDPVTEFLRAEQTGGVALVLGAVAALLWVNLGGAERGAVCPPAA